MWKEAGLSKQQQQQAGRYVWFLQSFFLSKGPKAEVMSKKSQCSKWHFDSEQTYSVLLICCANLSWANIQWASATALTYFTFNAVLMTFPHPPPSVSPPQMVLQRFCPPSARRWSTPMNPSSSSVTWRAHLLPAAAGHWTTTPSSKTATTTWATMRPTRAMWSASSMSHTPRYRMVGSTGARAATQPGSCTTRRE